MVVIRLAPYGKKGDTVYRITVADGDAPLTGKYIERLGIFKEAGTLGKDELRLDSARYDYWVKKGAQPTPRLRKVVSSSVKA